MPITAANLSGIVINEVMIDGSAGAGGYDTNGDGSFSPSADDFVELFNTSGSTVDISGWEIWDSTALRHVFAGGTSLPPGGRIVVIDDAGTGGAPNVSGTFVFSTTSNLGLASGGTHVQLHNPNTGEFIRLNVNNETNIPVNAGTVQVGPEEALTIADAMSLQRIPDGDTNLVEGSPVPGSPNCFLAGSLIATPSGERCVEDLRPSDLVLTREGNAVPVLFNFHQRVKIRPICPERLQPVRIRSGALGPKLPHSDLTLTGDHGVVIDDVIINAAVLVNNDTIDWVPLEELIDGFTVYHIETENHEIILANGLYSETFLDVATRCQFDNYQNFLDLYGADRLIAEMNRPRISARRLVPDRIKKLVFRGKAEVDFDDETSMGLLA